MIITYDNLQYIMEQIKAGRFATYSPSTTYIVGDIVFYVDSLYKCISEVTTAEPFNLEKWSKVTLAEAMKPSINDTTIII